MLTQGDDVEIHALWKRGWTVSAIGRHTGRDRKTIRKYLRAGEAEVREPAASCLEPFRGYIQARFKDDPHLRGTVLLRELTDAGPDRSYPTLVRELRRLQLRPLCPTCQMRRGNAPTVAIDHPAGEEIQWDWLELTRTPWGAPAYVLVGALSHSGRFRAVFCEQMTSGHLAWAAHRVLVGLGGTPRVCLLCGIPHKRHTCATLALEARIPLHVVAARLGDRPETLLATYAHLLPSSDAAAADAVAAVIVDNPLTNSTDAVSESAV